MSSVSSPGCRMPAHCEREKVCATTRESKLFSILIFNRTTNSHKTFKQSRQASRPSASTSLYPCALCQRPPCLRLPCLPLSLLFCSHVQIVNPEEMQSVQFAADHCGCCEKEHLLTHLLPPFTRMPVCLHTLNDIPNILSHSIGYVHVLAMIQNRDFL